MMADAMQNVPDSDPQNIQPVQPATQPPVQNDNYQDQITKLQKAGFSDTDIQNYSVNQAIKLRQAGFSQDEVDGYQGMQPPVTDNNTNWSKVPSDKDFKNAASIILQGNDHPFYQGAVDKLQELFSTTGTHPADAVKIAQAIPSFRQIMEQDQQPSYMANLGTSLIRGAGTNLAQYMESQAIRAEKYAQNQNLAVANSPLMTALSGSAFSTDITNPESTPLYQKGLAVQKWIDQKFPANAQFDKDHPIASQVAGTVGQLPLFAASGTTSWSAEGAPAYQEAKEAGKSVQDAVNYSTKISNIYGAMSAVPIGEIVGGLLKTMPQAVPFFVKKSAQMLASGTVITSQNEFADKMKSEVAQASDIPYEYKPTLQRVLSSLALGSAFGGLSKLPNKGTKTNVAPENEATFSSLGEPPTQPPAQPAPPAAAGAKLTPAYHFDSDSYGLKDEKGNFVQTGFANEAEAANAAKQSPQESVAEPAKVAPEVVDKYKQTVQQEAEKLGFNLTPEQLEQASKVIAEQHNPPNAEKPRTLSDVQSGVPNKTPVWKSVDITPKPVEVAPRVVPVELPKLPRELSGAKSGYKNATPQFASDIDKALYIVREKSSGKSASHDKYIDFLKNKAGLSDAEIQKGSENVLAAVKQNAEGKKGKVSIPHVYGADKNITINVPKKRTLAAMKSPMNALQLATSLGGIRDESGELKAMDADKHFGYGGRLVRNTGMSLDEFGQKLADRGYVKERPTKAETLEIIRNGLNGQHTYAEEDRAKLEARDEKGQQAAYNEDLERHAEEMGIDTKGMKPEEIRAALELQNKEAAAEHNFLDKVESYTIGEQEHANETIPLSAYEDGERGGAESNAGQQSNAGTEAGSAGVATDESSVSGRRTSADESEPFRTGEPSFESVKGIEGEQAVMPGMEKSAKQAMAARGEKIIPKGEQKPANEGLFADKEDRGDFLFQKSGLNRGILNKEFPSFGKLMELVDRIAPGASLRIQDLIDNGDAHGSYSYAENLIRIARTSPDVWHTLPHEAFHAIEHLLTPEERAVLLKEAADKGIMEKYEIAKNYEPKDHDKEALAHLFGDYASDKIRNPSPEAETIMDKIKEILSTIGAKVRELFGNESAKDILNKVFSGEVGQRTGERQSEGEAYQKAKDATLGEALKGIRDTFSPTSAGAKAKATEVAIRGAYGQAKRDRAISETALNEFARQANEMTPEEHSDFYNYVEGRSNGAQLKNKQFQKMADAIRKVYQDWRDKLQAMPETRMMNFVTDYFTHQWAKGQDEEIKEFMNSWWQQGSGKNLKERKIPTIADGLAYGLQLEEPNPVRAVSRYVGSMSNYIASVKVLRAINTELGGAFYADGMQPRGYMPLVGRNAERIENATIDQESGKLIPARNLKLYAPREVADLYNAFYSKGFEDTKIGSAYMFARNAINLNTMFELGLSAYHFSTINMQSFNQDMSRIMRNAFAGDWQGVGAALKGLVTPGLHFMQGQKIMQQYKDLADHGVDMETIANLFARSNMRLGLDPLANVSSHGGFYTAWQRGELPALMNKLKSQITQNYGIGALKSGAEVLQRAVSDVAHPLFSVYVPAIKMSAFHDLMGDWLRQNPDASDGEISVNALRIGNMVEDRFGEMNMENIFWNQKAKELLGLTFRAPGWDIGLVRQVGGAGLDVFNMLKDAAKGKLDPNKLDRPIFIAAAIVNYIALNAAMTYLKTGTQPSDQTYKNWVAYATGGMHKAFGMHPEQAELPGHGRELLQMAPVPGQGPLSGIEQETENKIATLPKKMYEDFTNKDWNGKPVYDPKSNSWIQSTPGVAQAAHLASGFVPFQMEQLYEGQAPGSNLSLAERFLGVRAAGAKIVAPEQLKEYNERHQ